jgi:hypothetical protein
VNLLPFAACGRFGSQKEEVAKTANARVEKQEFNVVPG